MSLEKIVRPFQTTDVFNARRLAPVNQPAAEEEEDVIVEWGAGISSNYIPFALSGLVGGSVKLSEISRTTSLQRIENPDDPAQFVEVERIETITLADPRGFTTEWALKHGT